MICSYCRATVPLPATFCNNCGKRLPKISVESSTLRLRKERKPAVVRLGELSKFFGKVSANIYNKFDAVREEVKKGIQAGQLQVVKKRCIWCRQSFLQDQLREWEVAGKTQFVCLHCSDSSTAIDGSWPSICSGDQKQHLRQVIDAIFDDAKKNPHQPRGSTFNDFILAAGLKHDELFPNE